MFVMMQPLSYVPNLINPNLSWKFQNLIDYEQHMIHIFSFFLSFGSNYGVYVLPANLLTFNDEDYREKENYHRCTGNIQLAIRIFISLVWLYGISTIVGYLMPNPLYTYILNIYDLVWLAFMAYQPLLVI